MTEVKPMTLVELKDRVDKTLEMSHRKEFNVCIPNNKGGMGGTSVTNVVYVGSGIDWDAGKFFIHPENKMIERPPDFTESEYQEALKRIKELKGALQRLVDAAEEEGQKHLGHTIRFSKSVLEIYNKKPLKK